MVTEIGPLSEIGLRDLFRSVAPPRVLVQVELEAKSFGVSQFFPPFEMLLIIHEVVSTLFD